VVAVTKFFNLTGQGCIPVRFFMFLSGSVMKYLSPDPDAVPVVAVLDDFISINVMAAFRLVNYDLREA